MYMYLCILTFKLTDNIKNNDLGPMTIEEAWRFTWLIHLVLSFTLLGLFVFVCCRCTMYL